MKMTCGRSDHDRDRDRLLQYVNSFQFQNFHLQNAAFSLIRLFGESIKKAFYQVKICDGPIVGGVQARLHAM